MKLPKIDVGFQVFVSDGGQEIGAVRGVAPFGRPELLVFSRTPVNFVVPLRAVASVHANNVILDCAKLEPKLRHAVGHAHDAEEPGA